MTCELCLAGLLSWHWRHTGHLWVMQTTVEQARQGEALEGADNSFPASGSCSTCRKQHHTLSCIVHSSYPTLIGSFVSHCANSVLQSSQPYSCCSCFCRCLVCERTLLGSRGSSPARDSTVSGIMAGSGSLPQFNAFRPSTASTAYTGPAATGETLGFGPLGPGLNAAQLRRMADEKVHGHSSSSSPENGAHSSEHQPEDGQHLTGSLLSGSLVVRASSPGLGNSVRYSSPGPYNHKQHQQQQGASMPGSLRAHVRPQTTGGMKVTKGPADASDDTGEQASNVAPAARQRPGTALGTHRGRKQQQEQQQQPSEEQQVQQQGQRQRSGSKRNPVFV